MLPALAARWDKAHEVHLLAQRHANYVVSGLAPVDQAIASWKAFVVARQGYQRLKALLALYPDNQRPFALPAPRKSLVAEGLVVERGLGYPCYRRCAHRYGCLGLRLEPTLLCVGLATRLRSLPRCGHGDHVDYCTMVTSTTCMVTTLMGMSSRCQPPT
jgi:hypothetical protein